MWFTMLYAVVYLVHDAVDLDKQEKTTRGTTKATKSKVLQGDGHTWHPTIVIVLATSESKTHTGQDCTYENTHPETLASVIAAKNVQNRNESEVQEAHYPTCSICDTKGHYTRDCRRWLDPEPDPEPPGIDRS